MKKSEVSLIIYELLIFSATVAQLVEQLIRNQQVAGSSPASSSNPQSFVYQGFAGFFFARKSVRERAKIRALVFIWSLWDSKTFTFGLFCLKVHTGAYSTFLSDSSGGSVRANPLKKEQIPKTGMCLRVRHFGVPSSRGKYRSKTRRYAVMSSFTLD